jgi:hypothetical protein
MYEWFHPNGDLKENYKRCVELGTYFDKASQHCPMLGDYPALRDEICNVLRKQRAGGQPLSIVIIQPFIKALIQKRAPQLLEDGKFKVSTKWTRTFIKSELNWSYRAATTAAGKLPDDFELQGLTMAQRCAYLIKVHNIPQSLVVNSDQTGIHLVPTGGARTWDTKGIKQVRVHGLEDKRQVTVVVSSAATGEVLPFQVVFQGLTSRALPPLNDGKRECVDCGWDLTFSHNHWSTMETCKNFIKTILSSYLRLQITLLGLPKTQEMIWLIDCWSVHISKEFRDWMKANYPHIHVLYIPANCTSIYQPADVILQRPFKHAFRQEFNKYTMSMIANEIETNSNIKVDFKMSTLKPLLCSWLFTSWLSICNKQEMVKVGWSKCGLLRSFDPEFQKDAMIQNMKTPLFKEDTNIQVDTSKNIEDEDIDVEESLEAIIEDTLSRVQKLSTSHGTASMASIRGMARKK